MNKILCKSRGVNTSFKENRTFRLWMVRENESTAMNTVCSAFNVPLPIFLSNIYIIYIIF